MSDWQPIETAPKGEDGEQSPTILILGGQLHESYHERIVMAFWGEFEPFKDDSAEGWCNYWDWDDEEWGEVYNPTHWMPLPAPPVQS